MDAMTILQTLSGLSVASGNTHPVTMPDYLIKYEGKDITADLKYSLLGISYTDYLGGQSD